MQNIFIPRNCTPYGLKLHRVHTSVANLIARPTHLDKLLPVYVNAEPELQITQEATGQVRSQCGLLTRDN